MRVPISLFWGVCLCKICRYIYIYIFFFFLGGGCFVFVCFCFCLFVCLFVFQKTMVTNSRVIGGILNPAIGGGGGGGRFRTSGDGERT